MRGDSQWRRPVAVRRLLPRLRPVVVDHDAQSRPLEVVELAAVHGEPEGGADHDREHDAQRDQQEEDVHAQRDSAARLSRSAFSTTSNELADMPMPAASGVTPPASASGIAQRL